MKIENEEFFVLEGEFVKSSEFIQIQKDIHFAIKSVVFNHKDKFIINPKRRGNGVKPIKNTFIKELSVRKWKPEERLSLVDGVRPGPIDSIKETSDGLFAVEWETGNISSSHRALNKIATGIIQHNLIGGIVVLPIRNLAYYLTDRIGNYEELEPYFPMYRHLNIDSGIIGVISVDYDEVSTEVDLIPKGTDGNAFLNDLD